MKSKFILFVIPFLFISCTTTTETTKPSEKKSEITIYCEDYQPEYYYYVKAKPTETGEVIILDPKSPEYENAEFLELALKHLPFYYAYDSENKLLTTYVFKSKGDENISLSKVSTVSAERLDWKIDFGISENEIYHSNIIILKNNKLRSLNPNSNKIIGKWIDVINDENRRTFIFKDDGTVDTGNEGSSDFCETQTIYEILPGNIIGIQTSVYYWNLQKNIVYPSLFYYDGRFLYDTIFLIKDITDDLEIQNAIKAAN